MSPFRPGFRVCDRRHPFLWYSPGQRAGRWNRADDEPAHYLAGTLSVAWAEWLRHQEIHDPEDLAGVAAALWAVLILADWDKQELPAVELPMELVLGTEPEAQAARLALVDQIRQQGTQALLAPTAALHRSDVALPCVRVTKGTQQPEELPGWCCVPEERPGQDLLPMVRREGMVAVTDAVPIP